MKPVLRTPNQRRAARFATILTTLGLACATAPMGSHGGASEFRPTMREIFNVDAPLNGTRPTDFAISADGRFASYRLPQPSSAPAGIATNPASRGARREGRAPLFIVSTRGGERIELGPRETVLWAGSGSKLLLTSGPRLQMWEPGLAAENLKILATLPEAITNIRLTPDGRRLFVSLKDKLFLYDLNDGGAPAAVILNNETADDRRFYLNDRILTLARKREERPASSESRPASSPAESSPAASRPSGEYDCILQKFDGTELARSKFTNPIGFDLEQAVAAADGASILVTFTERARDRRAGMLPDYLSSKVTTRPARGTNASDPWARQCLRAVSLGVDGLLEIEPCKETERQRFEIVASNDVSRGRPIFMIGRSAEDRKEKKIFAIRNISDDGGSRWSAKGVFTIPGPAGGIEQFSNGPGAPIYMSESSGRAQTYQLDRDGNFVAFSPPEVDVQWCQWGEGQGAEQQRVTVALISKPDSPWKRQFWRLFRSGSPHAPLPSEEMFISSPALSRDGSMILFLGSHLGEAEDLYTLPADGSGPARRLTFTSPAEDTIPGAKVPFKIIHYPAGDGTEVWSYLYEPPEGVSRNGAAVIFLHGAGYLQQVRASTGFPGYGVNHHFHRRLAAMGFVVLSPDFRGSSGYGRKFRTDVYQKLGIPDSADIVAAKKWLLQNEGVGGDRVGLYGGSYGGFLTLMCMFLYPTEFACGAALRSVTDWKTYQPEYTRPLFGGGPEEWRQSYHDTSPIHFADRLARPLLLLHGMMDDNVFVQDTIALVEKLQLLGKTDLFELMLYPSQNHTFSATHSWIDEYTRIENFFIKHLLNKPSPVSK